MKRIGSVETDQYSLTIYECDCGFHIGLDNTYMDQVGNVNAQCPACVKYIDTGKIDKVDEEVEKKNISKCYAWFYNKWLRKD